MKAENGEVGKLRDFFCHLDTRNNHPLKWMEMVISKHFLYKDLVGIIQIDSQAVIDRLAPRGSRHNYKLSKRSR